MIEAHNRHDLEKMLSYFSDDVKMIDTVAPIPLNNMDDVRALYTMIFRSLPTINFETMFLIAEGDQVFAGLRTTGTGSGVWGDKDVTGMPFDVYEGIFVRVVNGKINYFMGFSDSAMLTKQLGGYVPALGRHT